MNEIQIKIALLKRGIKQTEIADALNVSRQAISLVIKGQATSKRISDYIANLIGYKKAA